MARSAFNTEVKRTITRSLGRFIALFAIVALGCGFYAGLRMTCPDMKQSVDQYLDGTHFMDLHVVSTMGLTDDDLAALHQVDGVAGVMGAYETDVLGTMGDSTYTIRVHSLPTSAADSTCSDGVHVESADTNYLNRPMLSDGRWPENPDECVVSNDRVLDSPVSIGESIQITGGTDNLDDVLTTRTLTVVGFVHAPYYISSASMGTSSLGSGIVDEFVYVPESTFVADLPYTEAFVTVEGADALACTTDAYDARVSEVMDNVKAIASEREAARLAQLKGDAQTELDSAKADFQQQRSDVQAQLDDAQAELDEAAAQIAASQEQLDQGWASYYEGAAQLEAEGESAQARLNAAYQELTENQAQLDEGTAQLSSARTQLQEQRSTLQGKQDEWDAANETYQQGAAELQARTAAFDQALAAAGISREVLAGMVSGAIPTPPGMEGQVAALAAAQSQLDQAEKQAQDAKAQLDAGKQQLDAGWAQLEAVQSQLDNKNAQMEAARMQLADGWSQYNQLKDQVETQLAQARAQLAASRTQLEEGASRLEQGRADYESGLSEYQRNAQEAEQQFADAQAQLDEAQAAIDGIATPEWLVMGRDKNVGYVSYTNDADRVDHIASVFPFIFFLVAALVALTSMTRMVEEERVLIGTYKALGLGRSRIASKYLIYALAASCLGALVGILVLGKLLPAIIMVAYAIIYYVPQGSLPYDPAISGLAAGLGIGITVAATLGAAFATLREKPAALMLPRAPAAGKRILLERITPLWRRLSFSWKVTMRNVFRYKRRFLMTVIGIAGCTALLLTGWGLHDSINDIIDVQYGELVHYNAIVTMEDDATDAEEADMRSVMDDQAQVADYTRAMRDTMLAEKPDGSNARCGIVVPEDNNAFSSMRTMRERKGHHSATLDDDAVLIDEKLATMLGVKEGDTITLAEQDIMGNATERTHDFTVTGIVENYIYDYVFIGHDAYVRVMGQEPAYASYYARTVADVGSRDEFASKLAENGGVRTVAYNDETIDSYRTMLRSVDMIVVVLVVAAAALAFIVLYNLTNINIEERVREIATLKVLGFTKKETYAYIFREIMILAVLGALLGLVFGIFLEGFVVVSAEVDQVMFGRTIHPPSFVVSFVLTMVFSVAAMVSMRGKIARIDMVESLKSNE